MMDPGVIGGRPPRATASGLAVTALRAEGGLARGVDDALGVAVHPVDGVRREVVGRGSPEGGEALREDVAPDLRGERVEAMVGLGHRAAERGDAVILHEDRDRAGDEVGNGADVVLHVEVGRHDVRGERHDVGELQGEHAQLLDAPGGEVGDDLVVMRVDDGVDVGPEPQDLAVQVVADAGRHAAVEQDRRRDVRDHDVVDGHLLERDLRVLGVGDAVGEARVRGADGDVAERVVHVAAGHDQAGIPEQQVGDARIEGDLGHRFSLSRSSSNGAVYGYDVTSATAASSTRGPIALMGAFSHIGAKTTRSARRRWIWCSSSSRFLRSSSRAWRWKRSSTSGSTPYAYSPPRVAMPSIRVAALPPAPWAARSTPRSFFSRQAVRKAARSIVRMRIRIPTAPRLLMMASAIEK